MAPIIVNLGLLRCGQQTYESTNYNAARNVQVLSIDDQASAFLATDQDLDRAGGLTVSNAFDQVFDATPTESSQSITTVTTIGTGDGNFTIRRIAQHDNTAANVTTSSNTLFGGIDGQSLTKTADFTIAFTLITTFTDNS